MRNADSPPWQKPLLVVHVTASVGLIGAALALAALGIWSVLGTDPRTVYPAAYLLEAWLVVPLALVALLTGVLQAALSPWGLVRYWWVTIKLATTTAFAGVALFVLLPRLQASAEAATGPAVGEAFTVAERVPLAIAPSVAVALLILNVTLAVYKPGWRLRGRPKQARGKDLS